MFTRKISAIVGTLLALLTLAGTSTTAHATETPDSTAATPNNICEILPFCPRPR